jgi:hypothetical protein
VHGLHVGFLVYNKQPKELGRDMERVQMAWDFCMGGHWMKGMVVE